MEIAAVTNQINKEKLERAAYILKTVAHPTRLAILQILDTAEGLTVNDICEALDCEQSLISHHLINMKLRGILKSQKNGLNMYYSLKEREILNILTCIENCECNM